MTSPIQCAEVRRVWLSALHQLALADGDFSEGERRALADHLSKTLPDADLNWDGLPPVQDSDLAEAFAADRTLTEQFLRSAVVVSLADGHLSAMELDLLHHWADLLGCDQSPLKGLQPCDAPTSARSIHPLEPLKQWLDALDPSDPAVAGFIVSLIPAQCPFERDIVLFGHKLVHIPPMCKLNPLYDQLVGLRFRCLGRLPEDEQLRISRRDCSA
ncbi:MAG: Mo-dependent nitrogenase [Synechococcus sp. TMED90]|nr:MAG: Mo-dependent nitrogenase [Synechococcus sp. TMED90]